MQRLRLALALLVIISHLTPAVRRDEAHLAAPARRLDHNALTDLEGRLLGLGLRRLLRAFSPNPSPEIAERAALRRRVVLYRSDGVLRSRSSRVIVGRGPRCRLDTQRRYDSYGRG